MDEHLLSLSEQIYNIKDRIKDNEYLQIMNTLKLIYNSQDNDISESDEENSESDEDYQLQEIDYETDIVYTRMFKEYTCKCNTETYQSLCCESFNLFRYCKNYQKIVEKYQNLQYSMNLYFSNINNEYKIKFAKNINIDNINNSYDEFIEICEILFEFTKICENYSKQCLALIVCNFFIENLYYVINAPRLKFVLYDKINEIIRHDNNVYIDILIENGETIELLNYWLSTIKQYIPSLNED